MKRLAGIVLGIALLTALAALLFVAFPSGPPPRTAAEPAAPRSLPKFDVHTHVHPAAMERATALLTAHGIERFVNLSGGPAGVSLGAQIEAARRAGAPVVTFTSIDWRGVGGAGWLERELGRLRAAKAAGARGVKISKALGLVVRDHQGRRVPIDDPRLDPLFETMAELGFVCTIHAGDPVAFFEPVTPENERYRELSLNPQWSFYGPEYPDWETVFEEYVRRVERHPSLIFIGAHFGNAPEDPARVGALLDRLPNLYVDTAARLGELGRDDRPERRRIVRRSFLEHPDRILFGTDTMVLPDAIILGAPEERPHTLADADRFFAAHWRFFETADTHFAHPTPIQGEWTISGLDLPEAVLRKIYWENAVRLFGDGAKADP